MSSSNLRKQDWAKAPAALAIAITAAGAVLAAYWLLVAGFWTFATRDYGTLVWITAIAAFLICTPILGYRLTSKRSSILSLAATTPALLFYGFTLFIAKFG